MSYDCICSSRLEVIVPLGFDITNSVDLSALGNFGWEPAHVEADQWSHARSCFLKQAYDLGKSFRQRFLIHSFLRR